MHELRGRLLRPDLGDRCLHILLGQHLLGLKRPGVRRLRRGPLFKRRLQCLCSSTGLHRGLGGRTIVLVVFGGLLLGGRGYGMRCLHRGLVL